MRLCFFLGHKRPVLNGRKRGLKIHMRQAEKIQITIVGRFYSVNN